MSFGQFRPYQPLQFEWDGHPHGYGLAAANTITFVASATSTGASITIPAGAAVGDLAVLFDYGTDATPAVPSAVTPTNWTNHINTAGVTTARAMMSSRILIAGEPGSSITGMDAVTSDNKVMLVFRGSSVFTAPGASDLASVVQNTNPASQTANASGGTAPVIVFGAIAERNNTTPVTWNTESPAFTAEVTSNRLRVGYIIYDSSPSDHTVDGADNGNENWLASGYFDPTM